MSSAYSTPIRPQRRGQEERRPMSSDPTRAGRSAERGGPTCGLRSGTEPHHQRGHDPAGGGVVVEPRRSSPRVWRRAPRESATSSRCATRSTACARCWGSSSAASLLRSCVRCATRCPSCRWPTRVRRRPLAAPMRARGKSSPAEQPNAPAGDTKPDTPAVGGEAKDKPGAPGTEKTPAAGPAESSGRLWVPGR